MDGDLGCILTASTRHTSTTANYLIRFTGDDEILQVSEAKMPLLYEQMMSRGYRIVALWWHHRRQERLSSQGLCSIKYWLSFPIYFLYAFPSVIYRHLVYISSLSLKEVLIRSVKVNFQCFSSLSCALDSGWRPWIYLDCKTRHTSTLKTISYGLQEMASYFKSTRLNCHDSISRWCREQSHSMLPSLWHHRRQERLPSQGLCQES